MKMDFSKATFKSRNWIIIFLLIFDWTKDLRDLCANNGLNLPFIGRSSIVDALLDDYAICEGNLAFMDERCPQGSPSSPPSVHFSFTRHNYLPNSPLKATVYIEDKASHFRNFVVQAEDYVTSLPVGSFNSTYTDDDVRLVACNGTSKDTATAERSFRERFAFTVYWNPPAGFRGIVVFHVDALTTAACGRVSTTSVEIIPYSKECFDVAGSSYLGSVSRSKSGAECLRWSSSKVKNVSGELDEYTFVSNYCRSLKPDSAPGCYIMSHGINFEECDIPKCTDIPSHFIEFGESVGDERLLRNQAPGILNFTAALTNSRYRTAAVFEDGIVVLGNDTKSFKPLHLWPNGTFTFNRRVGRLRDIGVLAPFWTNIRRQESQLGQGYVYYRQSTDSELLFRLSNAINGNPMFERKQQTKYIPKWALIVTWHLVSNNASEATVNRLNTFQAVLMTDGSEAFALYNYEMRKWSDKEKTAVIGYQLSDGLEFLKYPNYIKHAQKASRLGMAVSWIQNSNIGRSGQRMYEVHLEKQPPGSKPLNATVVVLHKEVVSTERPNSGSRGDHNPCQNVNCGANGTCDIDTEICVCNSGYTGARCEVDIDECESNPCQNGGVCTDGSDNYHCQCRPGYTGKRCEQSINDCFHSPCHNGGTCKDGDNSFTCICPPQYTGKRCGTLLDQCSSHPCKNHGRCLSVENGYICECPQGYLGYNCQLRHCFDGTTCEEHHECYNLNTNTMNCTCSNTPNSDGSCQKAVNRPEPEPRKLHFFCSCLSIKTVYKLFMENLDHSSRGNKQDIPQALSSGMYVPGFHSQKVIIYHPRDIFARMDSKDMKMKSLVAKHEILQTQYKGVQDSILHQSHNTVFKETVKHADIHKHHRKDYLRNPARQEKFVETQYSGKILQLPNNTEFQAIEMQSDMHRRQEVGHIASFKRRKASLKLLWMQLIMQNSINHSIPKWQPTSNTPNYDDVSRSLEKVRVRRNTELCEAVSQDTQCHSVLWSYDSYTNISLPNTVNEATFSTQSEANGIINFFHSLNCHELFKFFVCASILPKCSAESGKAILPSQSFCNLIKDSCKDPLYSFADSKVNFETFFPCSLYPTDVAQSVGIPTLRSTTTVSMEESTPSPQTNTSTTASSTEFSTLTLQLTSSLPMTETNTMSAENSTVRVATSAPPELLQTSQLVETTTVQSTERETSSETKAFPVTTTMQETTFTQTTDPAKQTTMLITTTSVSPIQETVTQTDTSTTNLIMETDLELESTAESYTTVSTGANPKSAPLETTLVSTIAEKAVSNVTTSQVSLSAETVAKSIAQNTTDSPKTTTSEAANIQTTSVAQATVTDDFIEPSTATSTMAEDISEQKTTQDIVFSQSLASKDATTSTSDKVTSSSVTTSQPGDLGRSENVVSAATVTSMGGATRHGSTTFRESGIFRTTIQPSTPGFTSVKENVTEPSTVETTTLGQFLSSVVAVNGTDGISTSSKNNTTDAIATTTPLTSSSPQTSAGSVGTFTTSVIISRNPDPSLVSTTLANSTSTTHTTSPANDGTLPQEISETTTVSQSLQSTETSSQSALVAETQSQIISTEKPSTFSYSALGEENGASTVITSQPVPEINVNSTQEISAKQLSSFLYSTADALNEVANNTLNAQATDSVAPNFEETTENCSDIVDTTSQRNLILQTTKMPEVTDSVLSSQDKQVTEVTTATGGSPSSLVSTEASTSVSENTLSVDSTVGYLSTTDGQDLPLESRDVNSPANYQSSFAFTSSVSTLLTTEMTSSEPSSSSAGGSSTFASPSANNLETTDSLVMTAMPNTTEQMASEIPSTSVHIISSQVTADSGTSSSGSSTDQSSSALPAIESSMTSQSTETYSSHLMMSSTEAATIGDGTTSRQDWTTTKRAALTPDVSSITEPNSSITTSQFSVTSTQATLGVTGVTSTMSTISSQGSKSTPTSPKISQAVHGHGTPFEGQKYTATETPQSDILKDFSFIPNNHSVAFHSNVEITTPHREEKQYNNVEKPKIDNFNSHESQPVTMQSKLDLLSGKADFSKSAFGYLKPTTPLYVEITKNYTFLNDSPSSYETSSNINTSSSSSITTHPFLSSSFNVESSYSLTETIPHPAPAVSSSMADITSSYSKQDAIHLYQTASHSYETIISKSTARTLFISLTNENEEYVNGENAAKDLTIEEPLQRLSTAATFEDPTVTSMTRDLESESVPKRIHSSFTSSSFDDATILPDTAMVQNLDERTTELDKNISEAFLTTSKSSQSSIIDESPNELFGRFVSDADWHIFGSGETTSILIGPDPTQIVSTAIAKASEEGSGNATVDSKQMLNETIYMSASIHENTSSALVTFYQRITNSTQTTADVRTSLNTQQRPCDRFDGTLCIYEGVSSNSDNLSLQSSHRITNHNETLLDGKEATPTKEISMNFLYFMNSLSDFTQLSAKNAPNPQKSSGTTSFQTSTLASSEPTKTDYSLNPTRTTPNTYPVLQQATRINQHAMPHATIPLQTPFTEAVSDNPIEISLAGLRTRAPSTPHPVVGFSRNNLYISETTSPEIPTIATVSQFKSVLSDEQIAKASSTTQSVGESLPRTKWYTALLEIEAQGVKQETTTQIFNDFGDYGFSKPLIEKHQSIPSSTKLVSYQTEKGKEEFEETVVFATHTPDQQNKETLHPYLLHEREEMTLEYTTIKGSKLSKLTPGYSPFPSSSQIPVSDIRQREISYTDDTNFDESPLIDTDKAMHDHSKVFIHATVSSDSGFALVSKTFNPIQENTFQHQSITPYPIQYEPYSQQGTLQLPKQYRLSKSQTSTPSNALQFKVIEETVGSIVTSKPTHTEFNNYFDKEAYPEEFPSTTVVDKRDKYSQPGTDSTFRPTPPIHMSDISAQNTGHSVLSNTAQPVQNDFTRSTHFTPVCPTSVSENTSKGDVSWPPTMYCQIATVRCPFPHSKNATRECGGHIWLEPNMTECDELNEGSKRLLDLSKAIITAENASDVANQILSITENNKKNLIAYDIVNVVNILLKILEASGTSLERDISSDIVSSVSNIIDAPPAQIQVASDEFSTNSKFLRVIDEVLLKLELHSSQEYLDSVNVKVAVAKINNQSDFSGVTFSLSSDKVRLSTHPNQNQVGTSIVIPPSVTSSIPPASFSNRVQFALYTKTALFQNTRMISKPTQSDMMPNYTLLSKNVISASVGDYKISNLVENVTITLPKSASNFYGNGPYCVFYEFPIQSKTGSWSTDGCSLKEDTESSITCECNHLTNFAAIMDVYGTVEYFDEYQQKILQILTYIGCGLSIFGLLSTLISYTIFEKIRKEAPAKILISLCTALIAVNIVYLFMNSAYNGTSRTCVAVAAVMHYVLLSSLTWMGVEAINMYIALVRVFNTYYRRYMLKMSLIGWGAPVLIVGSAFAVQFITKTPSYEMNSKTEICWLRREVFYGTLVAPFGIIFLFNIVIYCLVLGQLLGMSSRKLKHLDSARRMRRPAKRENIRKIRGAIGLMALLGISWGFALATVDKAALTFSYVFVVFNSSQGFWVFLFHCVLKKEVCRAWKKLLGGKRRRLGDGGSRWSRFSSSNSKTIGTTKSTRSLSSSSIRTSYFVPKPSVSIDRSEVSIGLDSNGIDQVTRSVSDGYANPVFEEPGSPPPFPPPPVPSEERKVRRVPRKTAQGPLNTIATQTDSRFLEGFESNSDDDSSEERRDSVDDVFTPRGGMVLHRRVQMSPSNESGVYSDASVSSIAYPSSRHRTAARHHNASQTSPVDVNEKSTETTNHGVENGDHSHLNNKLPLRVDSKATDSGISTSGDMKESPSTSHDAYPKVLTNGNRSSFYSTHSRDSDGSTLSCESDIVNSHNPAPHLWKAPLVFKRKESDTSSSDHPTKISKEGKIKRVLWKKHHNHSPHSSKEPVEKHDLSHHNATRKFPKFQSSDEANSELKTRMVPNDDEAL